MLEHTDKKICKIAAVSNFDIESDICRIVVRKSSLKNVSSLVVHDQFNNVLLVFFNIYIPFHYDNKFNELYQLSLAQH